MTAPEPASVAQRQLGRIARGGAINLVGAVVSAVGGFLLVVVVTNEFDEATAGRLFAGVSAFLIGVAVATLGTDTGLARFVLPQEASGAHRRIRSTLKIALVPVLGAAVLLAVGALVAAEPLASALGLGDDTGPGLVRVLAAALPFAVLADFWLGATRAFSKMRPTVAIENILRPLAQLAAVGVVAAVATGELALVAGWAVPYVVTGLLATWVALRLVAIRTARADDPAARSVGPGEFWSYTWPRSIARIAQIALQRVDIVLIAALAGVREAALYTAATRFVVLGQFATQAIQRVLQPRLSQLIAREDHDTVRSVFKVSTAWSMALAWPIYLVVACSAPLYLQLFGSGYGDDAVPVVVVMSVAMMLAIAAGPLDTVLLMAGRSTASLVIMLIALGVDVALVVVLLDPLGIAGAAVAWGVAIVVRNLLTFVQVRSRNGVTPWSPGAAVVAAASLLCFAAPLLVIAAVAELDVVALAVILPVSTIAYAGLLWLARGPLELAALGAVLSRRGRRARVSS